MNAARPDGPVDAYHIKESVIETGKAMTYRNDMYTFKTCIEEALSNKLLIDS